MPELTEVQNKDVKEIEEKVIEPMTLEQLYERIDTDDKFRAEYFECDGEAEKEKAFFRKYTAGTKKTGDDEVVDDDEMIDDLPKEDAGKPDKGDGALLADTSRRIGSLEAKAKMDADALAAEKKRVDELQAKLDAATKVKADAAASDVKEPEAKDFKIEIPEVPDDFDISDDNAPEVVRKMAKGMKDLVAYSQTLTAKNDALSKRFEATAKELKEAKEAAGKATAEVSDVKSVVESAQSSLDAKRRVETEFETLDKFAGLHKDVFGLERGIEEVEVDYVAFVEDVKRIAGVKGDLYAKDKDGNPTNRFTDDVRTVINAVGNPKSMYGKQLREKCKTEKVEAPKDLENLRRLYAVRGIRQERFARNSTTGQMENIPLEDALDFYLSKNKGLREEVREKDRNDGRKAHAEAVSTEGFARETDPTSGPSKIDLAKVPDAKLHQIAAKGPNERTEEEKEIMRASMRVRGMAEEEIEMLV